MNQENLYNSSRNMYQNSQEVMHVENTIPKITPRKIPPWLLLFVLGCVLVLIGVGGMGGYYLVTKNSEKTSSTKISQEKVPEEAKTYTSNTYQYSFSYPTFWKVNTPLSGTESQILFYPESLKSEKLSRPVIEIGVDKKSFSESERLFSLKDEKTGYYVTDIKTVGVSSMTGYSFTPHICTRPICSKTEIILPLQNGSKTLRISNHDLDESAFASFLSSITIEK